MLCHLSCSFYGYEINSNCIQNVGWGKHWFKFGGAVKLSLHCIRGSRICRGSQNNLLGYHRKQYSGKLGIRMSTAGVITSLQINKWPKNQIDIGQSKCAYSKIAKFLWNRLVEEDARKRFREEQFHSTLFPARKVVKFDAKTCFQSTILPPYKLLLRNLLNSI